MISMRTADRVVALAGHDSFEGVWHDGVQALVSVSLWWPTEPDGVLQEGRTEYLNAGTLDKVAEAAVERIRRDEWFLVRVPRPAMFRLCVWAVLSHPRFMGLWREGSDAGDGMDYLIELQSESGEPHTIRHRTLFCAALLAIEALPPVADQWTSDDARRNLAIRFGISTRGLIATQDSAFAFDMEGGDWSLNVCTYLGDDGQPVAYRGPVELRPLAAPEAAAAHEEETTAAAAAA